MRQAGVETQLSLRQSDILLQNYGHPQFKQRKYYVYIYIHVRQRPPGCSLHEKSFASARVLNFEWEHIYVAEPISMSTPQMNYVNENSQNNRKEQRRSNNNNK